jgi:hypothetical protein
LKSQLQLSEYPRAWADYNRRWYAAWMIPLALLACYLASAFAAAGRPLTWILIAAFAVYVVLYLRFVRWPCPRCGKHFTMPDGRSMFRAKKCTYCGLQRNTIPEASKHA